jgi:hypothetical protein
MVVGGVPSEPREDQRADFTNHRLANTSEHPLRPSVTEPACRRTGMFNGRESELARALRFWVRR